MNGRPLYHPLDYSSEYSLLYGPGIFISLALMLSLSPDDPIILSKFSGSLWGVLALVFVLCALKGRWNFNAAWLGGGLVAAEVYYFDLWYPFGVRCDGIIFAMTCLSLFGLTMGRVGGGILIALSLAIAVDCKLHAFLYYIPLLMVWSRHHGLQSSLLVVGIAIAASFLPFLLPNVSLANYVSWLHMAGKHGFTLTNFAENVGYLLAILAPLALVAHRMPLTLNRSELSDESILLLGLLATGMVVSVIASKEGAGPHHLLPFLPYVGYLFCAALQTMPDKLELNWMTAFGVLLAFYLLVNSLAAAGEPFAEFRANGASLVQKDLIEVLAYYPPEQVQMGAGDNNGYFVTFAAPLLYRAGQPCVMNIGSLMDIKESGLTDDPVKKSLTDEQFRYWLIPRGEKPFTMESNYQPRGPLFDSAVADAFGKHYDKVGNSAFYDVYEARSAH